MFSKIGFSVAGKFSTCAPHYPYWSAKTPHYRASAHFSSPMEAGFVEKAEERLHSSAVDYFGIRKGKVKLIYLE